MWLLALIIFVAVGVTIFACQRTLARGQRPSVWLAVGSAFVASSLTIAVVLLVGEGADVFTAQYWEGHKVSNVHMTFIIVGLGAMFSLIPAAVVVLLFQRKAKR